MEDDKYAVLQIAGSWQRVIADIEKAGMKVLCPVVTRSFKPSSKRTRKLLRKEVPVYDGYVFLLWHSAIDWRPLLSIKGVTAILVNGGKPSLTTRRKIVTARSRMALANNQLNDGDEVSFIEGPFVGYVGTLRGLFVDISIFGRITPVLASMATIERTK